MFAFILESLGTTELIFILAIALIFFGPRKLPQLARSMGKGLAEFRKASDDFKRTWEREVAMESAIADEPAVFQQDALPEGENAGVAGQDASETAGPQLEPANSDWVVPRDDSPHAVAATGEATSGSSAEPVPVPAETAQPEPLRKHDWL